MLSYFVNLHDNIDQKISSCFTFEKYRIHANNVEIFITPTTHIQSQPQDAVAEAERHLRELNTLIKMLRERRDKAISMER